MSEVGMIKFSQISEQYIDLVFPSLESELLRTASYTYTREPTSKGFVILLLGSRFWQRVKIFAVDMKFHSFVLVWCVLGWEMQVLWNLNLACCGQLGV